MSPGLIPSDQKIWKLIRDYFEDGLPIVPYIQEIFLLECHIAGTAYQDLDEDDRVPKPGDPLLFRREPENVHDHLAVVIYDQQEHKLGYLPRAKNEVPARLMDAGKLLFAKVESSEKVGNWLKVIVRVYMRDL